MNKKTANKYAGLKKIVNKVRLKKLEIRSLNEIGGSFVVESTNQENISVSPKYLDSIPHVSKYPVSDIKIFKLQNVFCNINSSSYILKNKDVVYMEEFPYIDRCKANYASGFIHSHNNDFAYIKRFNRKKIHKYKNVFFLGGNGSFNFYHWMIEILPKLLLINNSHIDKYDIDTIVVNDRVKENHNYMWLLESCLSHLDKVNIVYVNQRDNIFVKNIFFMNTFNQTVYNFRDYNYKYSVSTIYNMESLKYLEKKLNIKIVDDKSNFYKKVFILRDEETVSKFNKRSYNQREVFDFFQKKGFVGISFGKLTLTEQARIFKNADFIVGPSGASWSNLIFAKSGAKAISWLPKQLKFFDTYSSLAYLHNVDMCFIEYETIDSSLHGPYNLPLENVVRTYEKMCLKTQV